MTERVLGEELLRLAEGDGDDSVRAIAEELLVARRTLEVFGELEATLRKSDIDLRTRLAAARKGLMDVREYRGDPGQPGILARMADQALRASGLELMDERSWPQEGP